VRTTGTTRAARSVSSKEWLVMVDFSIVGPL
jgi:hypothetical protein